MKIGFISDIHIDYNYYHDFRIAIMSLCLKKHLDYLVFAGDTTTDPFSARGFYDSLQNSLRTKILQIPGNHERYYYHSDYFEDKKINISHLSDKNFNDLLLNKTNSLFLNPIITENWIIIGHTGWYDYSFNKHYPNIDIADLHQKKKYFIQWSDCKYINGDSTDIYSDIKDTKESLNALEKILKKIKSDNSLNTKKICVVTHMVPAKEILEMKMFSPANYFMSFLGSDEFHKLYEKYDVSLGIFGHFHRNGKLRCNINGIDYANVSLGYNYQWQKKLEVLDELENSIYILEG